MGRALVYTLIIVLTCQCQGLFAAQINIFNPKDVLGTAKNATMGIISSIPGILPTPEEIFEAGKQLIGGYPFEVVSSAINKICSTAVATDVINPKITPDIQNMSFLLITPTKNYSYPLLDAEKLWKSSAFDKSKKTVILVTGWQTDLNEPNIATETIANAYFCRGDSNFVVVDTARYVDTLYTWSALNTDDIGESIGKALVQLVEHVQLENIHLIGHSLGAHIVGAAGRTFNFQTKKEIPRITGLDPAKPCFNEGEALSGLQRGDAAFIDVIHSNPGVLGKREPTGDVDFYPGGLSPLPNGCYSVTCGHGRAWEFYAETVYPGNENNFMGVRCSSLTRLRSDKCPGNGFPMGYAIPRNIRGNYFLEVNGESPYGINATSKSIPEGCK